MALAFKTKHLAIYEELRKDIVEGKLKPGQKIKISDVAKKYELSEIPVREAIRRLESDGFVEFTPYVGAIVSKMDEMEFVEIYLIRIELEALAARLAAEHVTLKDIHHLEKLNKEMAAAIQNDHPEELGHLNKEFHLRIYRAAPYPYLNKLISDLWEKVERTQSVFAYVPERAIASIDEHDRIIQALKSQNDAKVEELIKDQKARTMSALKKYLEKNI